MRSPDAAPEQLEEEGIPDPAADTSTAYDEADRPRFDDSPPPVPADRPQALDEFGLTGAEARGGEPLSDRLAREQPDVGLDDPPRDADLLEQDGPVPEPGPVSDYDRPDPGRPVGRLSEPDQQSLVDTEKDLIARDEGEAGGGATAEEAAMHEVDPDDLP